MSKRILSQNSITHSPLIGLIHIPITMNNSQPSIFRIKLIPVNHCSATISSLNNMFGFHRSVQISKYTSNRIPTIAVNSLASATSLRLTHRTNCLGWSGPTERHRQLAEQDLEDLLLNVRTYCGAEKFDLANARRFLSYESMGHGARAEQPN